MAFAHHRSSGSFRRLLLVLSVTTAVGFLLLLMYGRTALQDLEHAAQDMGEGQALVADILPPPLYLVELHLLAQEMIDAPVQARAQLARGVTPLKRQFQERADFWRAKQKGVEPTVYAALMGGQYSAAQAYWSEFEGPFLTHALAGEEDLARRSLRKLQAAYDEHRVGVEKTVKLGNDWAANRQADFLRTKASSLHMLIVVTLASLLAAIGITMLSVREIRKELGAEPAQLLDEVMRLSQGDFSRSSLRGETGSLLGALQVAQSRLQDQVERTEAHNLKLQQAVERLNRLSGSDSLTGLFNRRKIEEILAQEFERAHRYNQSLALIFIDIDHFKAINDRLGHDIGDVVLAQVASRIQEALRVTDVVARWGGEEFLVVCPGTAMDTASSLAERLRQTVATTTIAGAGQITLSAGVAQVLPKESWQDCFRRLDACLYRAKSAGRDQVQLA